MAIETYPVTAPTPEMNMQISQKHNTLVSNLESGAELRRVQVRFPTKKINLHYPILLTTERDTLQNFLTKRMGQTYPFWFVDPASRVWVDQYVGRGGPLSVIGAILADGSVMTNYTAAANTGTPYGVPYLPLVPADNDAFYVGGLDQFTKVTFAFSQLGVGNWTGVWEYWNGSAWSALTGYLVSDGTTCFKSGTGTRYSVQPLNGQTYQYTPSDVVIATTSSGRAWKARTSNQIVTTSPIISQQIFSDLIFTTPADWVIYNLYTASIANPDIDAYWIRMKMSGYTNILTQPIGCGVTLSSKTFDLRGISTSSVTVYVNGASKTGGGVDYTFVSGGGAAGSDRITFSAAYGFPAAGSLITSDFTGRLRMKTRLADDSITEEHIGKNFMKMDVGLQEVQW